MEDKDIKKKALEVYNISFNYHLTHAVFACDKLLENKARETGKKERKRLNEDLQAAYKQKDTARVAKLINEINSYKIRKYHLFVDYIDISDIEAGRVVNAENGLVITLPQKLADAVKNKDGLLQPEGVEKFRKVMGHELGHVVLHTEPLIDVKNLNGSKELKGNMDREADVFATELLHLYRERNHHIIKAAG